MFIELRIKQQNESFHLAAVFLQHQRCFLPRTVVISLQRLLFSASSSFFFVLQDTRIRVIEKESSGQKSRRLSIINPSPEGSQNLSFSTESSEELDDWLDALHQHLFDQSECVSAKHARVNLVETKVEDVSGNQSGRVSGQMAHLLSMSLTSPRWKPGQWLHCCNQLMKIEVVSPRKPSLFLTKQADSVYNDLSE